MGEKSPREMPMIVVVSRGAHSMLREVTAGIEEEGVPYSLSDAPIDVVGAVALAYFAACLSRLEVGVGIDGDGRVCIHHVTRRPTDPVAVSAVPGDLSTARQLAHNAARIVLGFPLKAESPANR